jgi:hypothetical protein
MLMRDVLAYRIMRTTLDIDDDVMLAAKELARSRKSSVGRVVSDLAREALTKKVAVARSKSGWPVLPVRPDAKPVTLELVNRLRDESP